MRVLRFLAPTIVVAAAVVAIGVYQAVNEPVPPASRPPASATTVIDCATRAIVERVPCFVTEGPDVGAMVDPDGTVLSRLVHGTYDECEQLLTAGTAEECLVTTGRSAGLVYTRSLPGSAPDVAHWSPPHLTSPAPGP